MDNVILFPTKLRPEDNDGPPLPSTLEEVMASVEAVRHVHINGVTEALISTLIQGMMVAGFNLLAEEHEKNFAFIIEAVRSSICKTTGIYHPFQDIAEKVMEDTDEEGVLKIAESINVKFQNESTDDEPISEGSSP